MSTLLGAPGLTEQPPEKEYIPNRGWETVRIWYGTEQACYGFASQLIQTGYRIRISRVENLTYGIEARIPDAQDGATPPNNPDDQQVVTWELVGNDLNKSLFDHDDFESIPLEDDKQTLRDLRDGRKSFTSDFATLLTGTAAQFRDLLAKGVQGFTVSQYVLRRTGTVPLDWNGQFAMTNVGKVYTSTSQLETEESVPATLNFVMPSGQWLKRTPSIRQQRDGRWTINNEWWHADEWSDLLYDAVT